MEIEKARGLSRLLTLLLRLELMPSYNYHKMIDYLTVTAIKHQMGDNYGKNLSHEDD